MPTVGIKIHRSRGMEISETCPSLGQTIATTMVSVRYEDPGRLSDPISRKLIVSLSVREGKAVGFTAGISAAGGAAEVGKSWAISTVAVDCGGWVGVGDTVSVGRKDWDAGAFERRDDACVGV
jgi:hypothetical protein